MRVYYLSWLRNKILKGEEQYAEGQKSRHGYTTVGNLEKCVHFRIGECPRSPTLSSLSASRLHVMYLLVCLSCWQFNTKR